MTFYYISLLAQNIFFSDVTHYTWKKMIQTTMYLWDTNYNFEFLLEPGIKPWSQLQEGNMLTTNMMPTGVY